jgi:uncharacterized membrane protein (DUF4010 family)
MDTLDLFYRLTIALAIGLMIGIERGWTMRAEGEGERTAGLRTLALTGLLGGVTGALARESQFGGMLIGLVFLSYALVIGFLRSREMTQDKTFGATTIVAALVTLVLGVLAVMVDPGVAAAAGVAATALLALKAALHGWLAKVTWEELRAGLALLAMTLILLPLLPDRALGPFEAINPHELWLMTILIAAVSAAGYVAMKWGGGRRGVALSGIAGGLVSSTAVTLSFARLARQHPERGNALAAGMLLAGVTMMARVVLVAGSVNGALLTWLLPPLSFAALATGALAGWYLWGSKRDGGAAPLEIKTPFEIATVLKFGALLALVMVAAKGLAGIAGERGIFALAAVSGIADVDAITLTLARLGGVDLATETAAVAILLATTMNTLAKVVLAWVAGGRAPGLRLASGAGLAVAAGIIGFWASPLAISFAAFGAAFGTHLIVP